MKTKTVSVSNGKGCVYTVSGIGDDWMAVVVRENGLSYNWCSVYNWSNWLVDSMDMGNMGNMMDWCVSNNMGCVNVAKSVVKG
uniref:Uncharacterized protein n=1 Tax=Bracon brevicornis TaxID=1563983 RepID=A0A6V7LS37_9HYME